jgi:hypothetical protein
MIEDGVYFQMPQEQYHALPFLSASGIKNLLISPMDFWARSWMNPLKDIDEDAGDEPEWKITGNAYHARILEGRAAFEARYAATFDAPDGCLKTIDDIKEHLEKKFGIDTKGCKSKNDYIVKLRAVDSETPLYDEVRADYLKEHEGKEFMSHKAITRIELSAAMIENHPHINKCFRGGYPEVSVVWTEGGIRFKSRFDYVKAKSLVDLKTFANMMNKPIDGAIYSAMASRKYHIQASLYLRAVHQAQSLPVIGESPNADWLEQFRATEQHEFWFVFQQKGVAPLARLKRFTRGSLWSCGEVALDEGISRYKLYLDKYGTNLPWVDDSAPEDFDDSMFPAYTTEL